MGMKIKITPKPDYTVEDPPNNIKLDKLAIKLEETFPELTFIERMIEARKILDLNYKELKGDDKTIFR